MRYFFYILILIVCSTPGNAYAQPKNEHKGFVKIAFRNLVNHSPLVLYDSTYINPFGEDYTVTKLKYYISNTTLFYGPKIFKIKDDYHLIDQSVDTSLSFTIPLPANQYDSIQFLLGVDSAMNTSGAQTGALDPMNDMFWTWNSGYVMEKIEGNSSKSNVVNNKIEYHLGGFKGPDNVLNTISFHFDKQKPLEIVQGKTTTIFIDFNLNKFWNAQTNIKISDMPVCTQPGSLAKTIAGNFSTLFSLSKVTAEK